MTHEHERQGHEHGPGMRTLRGMPAFDDRVPGVKPSSLLPAQLPVNALGGSSDAQAPPTQVTHIGF